MLSSVQKSKHKTYAEAARLKTVSLHNDITPHPQEDRAITRVLQTRIYRSSRADGASLFDLTESFCLNGTRNEDWGRYLQQNNISIYYNKFTLEPFRYLGFYMVYTIHQRNVIQDKLIHIVTKQVKIYSLRHLSLRGRATVANTLIMTKVWYSLRLLQPTQAFLGKLKTIIYNYVWQAKRPMVSFLQLSLPLVNGGIGLLLPATQHLVLQIRHLHHAFYCSNSSELVRPFFKYHMSLITPAPMTPEMSFFIPEWRNHPLHHPIFIIHACYRAFDHFGFFTVLHNHSITDPVTLSL